MSTGQRALLPNLAVDADTLRQERHRRNKGDGVMKQRGRSNYSFEFSSVRTSPGPSTRGMRLIDVDGDDSIRYHPRRSSQRRPRTFPVSNG